MQFVSIFNKRRIKVTNIRLQYIKFRPRRKKTDFGICQKIPDWCNSGCFAYLINLFFMPPNWRQRFIFSLCVLLRAWSILYSIHLRVKSVPGDGALLPDIWESRGVLDWKTDGETNIFCINLSEHTHFIVSLKDNSHQIPVKYCVLIKKRKSEPN